MVLPSFCNDSLPNLRLSLVSRQLRTWSKLETSRGRSRETEFELLDFVIRQSNGWGFKSSMEGVTQEIINTSVTIPPRRAARGIELHVSTHQGVSEGALLRGGIKVTAY